MNPGELYYVRDGSLSLVLVYEEGGNTKNIFIEMNGMCKPGNFKNKELRDYLDRFGELIIDLREYTK